MADGQTGLHRLDNQGQFEFDRKHRRAHRDDLRERIDIGLCPGLCLGPPAVAGVRSKQGELHGGSGGVAATNNTDRRVDVIPRRLA